MIRVEERERITKIPYKVYITSDGREFERKFDADHHEAAITPQKNIPHEFEVLALEDTPVHCYKIKSQDDLFYLQTKIWEGYGIILIPRDTINIIFF